MAAEDRCATCGEMKREHRDKTGRAFGCGFVEREEDKVWMIVYDDAERQHETFSGHGAHDAALRRFDDAALNWNCHLFERIASA